MNQPNSRNWGNLLILLLLPAPLTAIAVMLGLTALIANPDIISFGGDDDSAAEVADAVPQTTLDSQVAALATVNAIPERDAPAPSGQTAGGGQSGEQALEVPAAEMPYSPEMVEAGQVNYLSTCSACHNTDATGISGLGKPLVNSEFMRSRTDEELVAFIIAGRTSFDPENTTGVTMPPRGGNPGLTDEDIHEIVAYLRVLDGVPPPDSGEEVAAAPEDEQTTSETETTQPVESGEPTEVEPLEPFEEVDISAFLASLNVSLPDPVPQPVLTGEELYVQRCAVCHGDNAEGIEFLGSNLRQSDVLRNGDYATIFNIIHNGVPVWSPENEAGVHMPPSGGYPELTEEQIDEIIAYLQGYYEAE